MPNILSVGIDVSKATLEVALLHTDQTDTTRSFANTGDGLTAVRQWFKSNGVACATPIVIESTGDYHLLSALTISRAGFRVNVINPIITKQYQRASIRDAKTDKIDAVRLARIALLDPAVLRPFVADGAAIGGKKILSLIALLERTKQQLAASVRQFKETQRLLALPVHCDGMDEIIESLDDEIADLQSQLTLSATAQKVVTEVRGISARQMAVVTTALAGTTFATRDQLVAYVGLDVRKRESGTWHGKEKLSKRGNPYVRKILFQMGWSLKQNNPTYQQYYQQLRDRGKHYTTCIIALARKFLRFLFRVLFANPSPFSTAMA